MVKTTLNSKKTKKTTADQCNICFERIKKYKGTLSCHEKCKSKFCFDCIKQWSKKENKCPCCKTRFENIKKVNIKTSKASGEVHVEDKTQSSDPPDISPSVYWMVQTILGRMLERSLEQDHDVNVIIEL